jgi:membrane protein YqaA with SNARE-associated domain|tara:strand:+ start:6729 stop:7367 length:639 start_codon:yes stop_codon:yes gene_type:complete
MTSNSYFTKIKGFHIYAFGLLRKLYNWVLSWAHKKYSSAALFVLAFSESSFFPIPPDVLQIALSVSRPKKSFFYALIASLGSILGGILGYFIGLFLFDTIGGFIINTLGYQSEFNSIGNLYKSYAFLVILASAFTPIPYKVFTIAAGFWQVGLLPLIAASVIGRSARFFLVATLIYIFGPKIKEFIDKYFNLLTIIFIILLISGFLIIKYLL